MISFEENCINKTKKSTNYDDCSIVQMKKTGIDSKKIIKCVEDSFDSKEKEKWWTSNNNSILYKEYSLFKKEGVQMYPAVIINNVLMRVNE